MRQVFSVRHLRLVMVAVFTLPTVGQAYVGPGAGFAFLTSFLVLFVTIWVAFLSILTWPVRSFIQRMKRRFPKALRRRSGDCGGSGRHGT